MTAFPPENEILARIEPLAGGAEFEQSPADLSLAQRPVDGRQALEEAAGLHRTAFEELPGPCDQGVGLVEKCLSGEYLGAPQQGLHTRSGVPGGTPGNVDRALRPLGVRSPPACLPLTRQILV